MKSGNMPLIFFYEWIYLQIFDINQRITSNQELFAIKLMLNKGHKTQI